jgi:hypothetical protein
VEGKRSTLSDERVRLLNTIGFVWNSHDAVFHERLQDLTLFKQTHGHCVVPSNYEQNVQLAVWTKRQRRQYKIYQEGSTSSLTPDRITKLEAIGFIWDCRKLKNNLKDVYEKDEPKNAAAMSADTVSVGCATHCAWTNPSPSILTLVAQQNQMDVFRNHRTKNQLLITTTTSNDNIKAHPQNGNGDDDNQTAVEAKMTRVLRETGQKTVEDYSGSTTTMTAFADSDQTASQPRHQQQNKKYLLKVPRCEFFSFSCKFQYLNGSLSNGPSNDAWLNK